MIDAHGDTGVVRKTVREAKGHLLIPVPSLDFAARDRKFSRRDDIEKDILHFAYEVPYGTEVAESDCLVVGEVPN